MINNRQANGRRRGRGGQQQQGRGGNPNQRDNGNRIDNRARGNAAQLLEKYKNLARDAQMQGDRVNAEYYLQFADHYFRVLSETRSRFEEQNPNAQNQNRRPRDDEDQDEDFDFEADGNREDRDYQEPRQQQPPQQQRDNREPRENRGNRDDREARGNRDDREPREAREPREIREPREAREPREPRNGRPNGNGYANGNGQYAEAAPAAPVVETNGEQERAPRRRGRPRRDEAVEAEAPHGIDLAVLPPAFGIEATADAEAGEEAPKKPRRRRTAKSDDTEVSAS